MGGIIRFDRRRVPVGGISMHISCGALVCALAVAVPARAAEPAADVAPTAEAGRVDTGFAIGEQIVVSARSMAASSQNVLTSIDRMGGDVAQRANVNYAWELVGACRA
jgi:iron complex outermembrane receptor protein